jgi:hypothetical protein
MNFELNERCSWRTESLSYKKHFTFVALGFAQLAKRFAIKVKGTTANVDVDGDTPLLWVLRDKFGLTGTKFGCGIAVCAACTVFLDGKPLRSCSLPISALGSGEITTIEGISGREAASQHLPSEGRSLLDRGVKHSRNADVDAENRAAVAIGPRVQSRNRLADQGKLALIFEARRGIERKLCGVRRELAVG